MYQLKVPLGVCIDLNMSSATNRNVASHNKSTPPVHLTVAFAASTSSLSVHKLDVETAGCNGESYLYPILISIGPQPVIVYRTKPKSHMRETTHETRFYSRSSSIFLHSHSCNAPFLHGQSSATTIDIDVYQTPDCPVTHMRLSYDLRSSLGKIIIRYRMSTVAWTIGWVSTIILYQLSIFEHTGT